MMRSGDAESRASGSQRAIASGGGGGGGGGGVGGSGHFGRSDAPHFSTRDLYCNRPLLDVTTTFYHSSQQSAKTCRTAKHLEEILFGVKRAAMASCLRDAGLHDRIRFLPRIPLNNQVTLTVEAPHLDTGSVMSVCGTWCGNESIMQIMHDNNVMIHFADSVVDAPESRATVNQVKITGQIANVEQARQRIRNFAPVSVMFPLCSQKASGPSTSVKEFIERAIAEKRIDFPFVDICVVMPANSECSPYGRPVPACIVRASTCHEEDICDACKALQNILFEFNGMEKQCDVTFSTMMDIPVAQQFAVAGFPDGFLLQMISIRTCTSISFPTQLERNDGATTFVINGPLKAILAARKYIQGMLPVTLEFDVDDVNLVNRPPLHCREAEFVDDGFDVHVYISKSRLEGDLLTEDDTPRHCVTIESMELNLASVYVMRQRLLFPNVTHEEPQPVCVDLFNIAAEFKRLVSQSNKYEPKGMFNKSVRGVGGFPMRGDEPPQHRSFDCARRRTFMS